jgi:peptidoglycan-associated lipoprotein
MRPVVFAFVSMFLLTNCAHTQKPMSDEVIVRAPPPAPTPASKPAPVVVHAAAEDPAAELKAALRGSTVYFGFDSDRLNPEGMEALQRVAKVLRKHPTVAVSIEGNCDERGTEEYNLMLGQRRAAVARKYLADLGVSGPQLDTISYGSNRPANPAHDEAAWNQNRRDELRASK